MALFKNLFYKPLTTQLTITSVNGFHLRPVAQFSSLAKAFSCQITATFNGKTVDTKSVNTLLSLSLEKGDTFTLSTQGKKAQEALTQLQKLFETLMQDDKEVHQISKSAYAYEGDVLKGEIISKGVTIANTYRYRAKEVQFENKTTFNDALSKSIEELETLFHDNQKNDNAGIFLAQKELLASLGEVSQTLAELETTIIEASQKLSGTKLEAKRADYQDILQRVKKHLGFETQITFPKSPFILLCEDLLPSEIEHLQQTDVAGVVLKETSINSHTAILLRSAAIPSLIADIEQVIEGAKVILDTHAGVLVQSPTDNDLQKSTDRLGNDLKLQRISANKRFEPAYTQQGKKIRIFANVSDVNSAKIAKEEGAEGIGLLRSEFLFQEEKPALEVQHKAYKEIFELFEEITVRTLDVGGDKALPYIELPREENPFLGIRGVRLFQTHPDLLEEQLHAIFLAAQDKSIKIMFPMVSSVDEFIEAKDFAQRVAQKFHIDISHLQFGIMVEVPSVLFLIEKFNDVVDFYSIGTNDLTQYLFAIERTHPSLRADPLSSVVFDAIKTIVEQSTKPVSICGELAGDKKAISKLVELGIETLSVSGKNIPQTKQEIRNV
jgi:multiphosphoryl transfer protein